MCDSHPPLPLKRSGSRTLGGTEIIGNEALGPQEAEGWNLVPCLGPTPERD